MQVSERHGCEGEEDMTDVQPFCLTNVSFFLEMTICDIKENLSVLPLLCLVGRAGS